MAILATATSKGRINFCGSRGLLSAKLATFSEKLFPPLHNVYYVQYDATVSFLAQVTYFVSQVLVVDTVTYFQNIILTYIGSGYSDKFWGKSRS